MGKYSPCLVYGLSPTHCYARKKCRCTVCVEYTRNVYRNRRKEYGEILKRNYIKNKPDYIRRARKGRLMRDFGLTVEKYTEMYEKQNHRCLICFNPERKGYFLSVDHNHKTGKIRGLLCNRCNVGIGMFEDNKHLLINATDYLDNND